VNEVDVFIIVVLGLNIYYGATRGLLRGIGDLVALFAALGIGSLVYPAPSALLRLLLGLPPVARDMIGFVASAVGVAVGVGYLFAHVAERRRLARATDGIGGGAAGAIVGAILASLLLMLSGVVTGTTQPIDRSALAPQMLEIVPAMHLAMDRVGLPIPKLVMLPPRYELELGNMRYGPQFMRLDFARIEGATCIKCRGPLEFLGYKRVRGSRLAPKFRCRRCARTSDGCQSFQGMHAIYDQCPVVIARRGIKLNCGIWSNRDWVYPRGRCPVDGNELSPQSRGVTEPRPDVEDPDLDLPRVYRRRGDSPVAPGR
jgi:uncharacterized membrane protein required for colicin V production